MFYSSLRKLELIPVIYMAQTYLYLQLHVCGEPKLSSVFSHVHHTDFQVSILTHEQICDEGVYGKERYP